MDPPGSTIIITPNASGVKCVAVGVTPASCGATVVVAGRGTEAGGVIRPSPGAPQCVEQFAEQHQFLAVGAAATQAQATAEAVAVRAAPLAQEPLRTVWARVHPLGRQPPLAP